MYQNIYVQQKSNTPISKIDMTSRLFEDANIYIFGDINDETAYGVIQQLQYLSAKDPSKDITIYINSPGGSVSAGLAIHDVMISIPNDVTTVCIGICASMAAFLFSAGTKGKRIIYPNSEVLIHQPWSSGISGQVTDIEIAAEHIKRSKATINKFLSKYAEQPLNKIEKDTDRDYWMSASEAIDYGICDKIFK